MSGQDETQTLKEGIEIITDLYNNHQGMAYEIVHKVLGQQISLEDKEDLVQEGFMQMISHLDTLLGSSKRGYYRYLRAIMFHVAISEGRRLSRKTMVGGSDVLEEELEKLSWPVSSSQMQIFTQVEKRQSSFVLYRALACLKQQDFDLIAGFYYFDLEDKVVGKYMGIPYGFVRVYRKRALKRLSKAFVAILEQDRKDGRGFF